MSSSYLLKKVCRNCIYFDNDIFVYKINIVMKVIFYLKYGTYINVNEYDKMEAG